MFRCTTNTLYNHTVTGSFSNEVVTEVSIVLCYITMNLTAFIKCVKTTTPALSPNTVAHSLILQTCILTVQILTISKMNLTKVLTVFSVFTASVDLLS